MCLCPRPLYQWCVWHEETVMAYLQRPGCVTYTGISRPAWPWSQRIHFLLHAQVSGHVAKCLTRNTHYVHCPYLCFSQGCVWAAVWDGAIWSQQHFRGGEKRPSAPLNVASLCSRTCSSSADPCLVQLSCEQPSILLTTVLFCHLQAVLFFCKSVNTRLNQPVNGDTGGKLSRL